MAPGDTITQVPVIDFESAPDDLQDRLGQACETWGIFHLINHGIPEELTECTKQVSAAFFAQVREAKQSLSRTLENPWGYYDRELTKNLRDRKEIFDFGSGFEVPWPEYPSDFQSTLEAYSLACHQLGLQLVEAMGASLGLESSELQSAFTPVHSSFTRLNYYPVHDALENTDSPPAGPLGISRHTDAGGLTILLQDRVAGLQVYQDQWQNIEPHPGALTVNVGDMLQVWSNDRFRAPLHRVSASEDQDRYSIAYFLNPAPLSVVEPLATSIIEGDQPHFRAVHWGEFRDLRAQGDYGDFGEEVQISHYRIND